MNYFGPKDKKNTNNDKSRNNLICNFVKLDN